MTWNVIVRSSRSDIVIQQGLSNWHAFISQINVVSSKDPRNGGNNARSSVCFNSEGSTQPLAFFIVIDDTFQKTFRHIPAPPSVGKKNNERKMRNTPYNWQNECPMGI